MKSRGGDDVSTVLLLARQALIRWTWEVSDSCLLAPSSRCLRRSTEGSATSTGSRSEPEAENRKEEKCARFHLFARSALAHFTSQTGTERQRDGTSADSEGRDQGGSQARL